MHATVLAFLAAVNLANAAAGNLESVLTMAQDLKAFFDSEYAATVLDSADICLQCIGYLDYDSVIINDGDRFEVISDLMRLQEKQELDFLVIPEINESVMTLLENELNLFKSKIITIVPRQISFESLKLRLDTQLYYYDVFEDLIKLYEVYAVKNGPQINRQIGNWTLAKGLHIEEPQIWKRRSDLMGTTLRNAVLSWSVFNNLTFDGDGKTVVSNRGIFHDIMVKLGKQLNFTQTVERSRDGKWGGFEPDGVTWNGMVRMLMDGAIDVCTSGLTHYVARDAVVDFTVPILREGTTLVAPRNGQ